MMVPRREFEKGIGQGGVHTFVCWCRRVKRWSNYPTKKLYREQVRYWLDLSLSCHRWTWPEFRGMSDS